MSGFLTLSSELDGFSALGPSHWSFRPPFGRWSRLHQSNRLSSAPIGPWSRLSLAKSRLRPLLGPPWSRLSPAKSRLQGLLGQAKGRLSPAKSRLSLAKGRLRPLLGPIGAGLWLSMTELKLNKNLKARKDQE